MVYLLSTTVKEKAKDASADDVQERVKNKASLISFDGEIGFVEAKCDDAPGESLSFGNVQLVNIFSWTFGP